MTTDLEKLEDYVSKKRDRIIEILMGLYGNNWRDKSEEYCRVVDAYTDFLSKIARINGNGAGKEYPYYPAQPKEEQIIVVIRPENESTWCAHGPDFIDLVQSQAGFGNTPEEAACEYLKTINQQERVE